MFIWNNVFEHYCGVICKINKQWQKRLYHAVTIVIVLSPLSLCCHHCHCVAQTLNILMFCRGSTLRNHHNYLSICADKRSSSFTLGRNRGFHFWKVWKCNLGKKMNSSVLGSTTTCKVSLSISLSTTLSVRNQQLSGVPTYMCCCNLSFGVALSAEWSRYPRSMARCGRDSVAPLRRSSAG